MSHVYVTPILEGKMKPVWPPERQQQLEETTDMQHRRARYTAWRLLRYALMEELGLELEKLQFTLENGKWTCPDCYLSISHSGRLVAVAVGKKPVGVDLQKHQKLNPQLADKILTPTQMEQYKELEPMAQNDLLLRFWCEKECLFKMRKGKTFRPKQWESKPSLQFTTLFYWDDTYSLVANAKLVTLWNDGRWNLKY